MSALRRLAGLLALTAVLAAPASALGARASLPDIERQVMCTVCGVPLELANSPEAIREKAFIAGLIARGDDTAQIKRALVAQYGSDVLALPPARGFDLTVYVVPAVVVVGVGVLLALSVPRWRRRAPAPAISTQPGTLAPEDAKRLEEDLHHYDAAH